MKEVYEKILLDPSNWDEKTKSFKFNSNDINEGFKKLGYKEYCFCGFSYIFTKTELTPKEIEKYETEAQEAIDTGVDEITKEINKRILEDMKRKKLI